MFGRDGVLGGWHERLVLVGIGNWVVGRNHTRGCGWNGNGDPVIIVTLKQGRSTWVYATQARSKTGALRVAQYIWKHETGQPHHDVEWPEVVGYKTLRGRNQAVLVGVVK